METRRIDLEDLDLRGLACSRRTVSHEINAGQAMLVCGEVVKVVFCIHSQVFVECLQFQFVLMDKTDRNLLSLVHSLPALGWLGGQSMWFLISNPA